MFITNKVTAIERLLLLKILAPVEKFFVLLEFLTDSEMFNINIHIILKYF